MMSVEVTVVPQCRVGLAPTASLMSRLPRSGGDRYRVVFGAVGGNHRIPFAAGGDDGMKLAQDRRGDDGLGLGRGERLVGQGMPPCPPVVLPVDSHPRES
jgi:hypothetical protein